VNKALYKTFNNIPIMPIQQVLGSPFRKSEHKLGPIWPNWNEQSEVRFKRRGKLRDDVPSVSDGQQFTFVEQKLYWCGAIVSHFGHQITDFSTRIASYKNLGLDGYYAFSVSSQKQYTFDDTPAYFKEIIEWFEIPSDRLLFVNQPVLANELIVVPQQEQLPNIGPSDDYLNLLDEFILAKNVSFKKNGKIFVSRAGQPKGVIAGEKYIESIFSDYGFEIFKPEEYSLENQLKKYLTSEIMVFSEGSALHSLQLLGRNLGTVHILERRPNLNMCKQFIKPRAIDVGYHIVGQLLCGLKNNKPLGTAGITVADHNKLQSFLSNVLGQEIIVDKIALDRSIQSDIRRFMENEVKSPRSNFEGYITSLRKTLSDAGFPECINEK
jgi:hypothetical protein